MVYQEVVIQDYLTEQHKKSVRYILGRLCKEVKSVTKNGIEYLKIGYDGNNQELVRVLKDMSDSDYITIVQ